MKKIFNLSMMALLFSAALIFVTSCNDDDKNTNEPDNSLKFSELPSQARLFVQNHFDEGDVDVVLRSTSEGTEGYYVSVKGYEIDFDKDGNWEKIEAKDKGALPDNIMALVPTSIIQYVEFNYPDRGMHQIKKKDYGYKVELAGKPEVELKFDFDGNILKVNEGDDDGDDNDDEITLESLPEISQVFIKEHFASYTVKEVKKDKNSFEVEFTDKTEVEFYASGEWKKVEADNNIALPESVLSLLPETAVSYIKTTYPGKALKEIENKEYTYEVELYKDIEISFDKEGNVWDVSDGDEDDNDGDQSKITYESLPQAVKDFVAQHFPNTKVLYVNKTYKEYKIGLVDGTRMDFTFDNKVQAIVSVRNGIPTGAVLPAIADYVNQKYPNKKMTVYIKQYGGYMVEMSGYPVSKVFFDLNGNFLRAYN